MDKLIRGTFKSEYPNEVKIRVLKGVKKSGIKTLPGSSLQVKKDVTNTCLHFIIRGNEFELSQCVQLLSLFIPLCQDAIQDIFTPRVIEELIQGIWKEQPESNNSNQETILIAIDVAIFRRVKVFDLLLSSAEPESSVKAAAYKCIQTEAIQLLHNSKDHQSFGGICRLLTLHPECFPHKSRGFALCILSIHAMSDFPFNGDVNNVSTYIKDVGDIAGLLQYVWRIESATLIPSLREIFNIISSDNNAAEPSNALGCLVEFIPVELTNTLVHQLVNDPTITDSGMYYALNRMLMWLAWPTAIQAHIWILQFFQELSNLGKFSMLMDVTVKTCRQVFMCLRIPAMRGPSIGVLVHMLISYRASPDVFHIIVPDIPDMILLLESENNPEANGPFLKQISNLCFCMMFLHTGFPELYTPLLKALKDFPRPTRKEISTALRYSSWSDRTESSFYELESHQLNTRSTDTDRAGLVNLGNTCYMNSVVQAIFMAEEFRFALLKLARRLPATSVTRLLERTFGHLLLTKRIAHEPRDLVEHSRPSWFASGAQQDCSEYMKFLLDQLHEEEKRVPRSTETVQSDCLPVSPPMSPEPMETNQAQRSSSPAATALIRPSSYFRGQSRAVIQCSVCSSRSSRVEDFVDICLPLDGVGEPAAVQAPVKASSGQASTSDVAMTSELTSGQPHVSAAPSSDDQKVPVMSSEVAVAPMRSSGASAFIDDPDGAFPVQVQDDVTDEPDDVTTAPRKTHKLVDLMTSYLRDELMQGDNRYFCNNCNRLQNAVKKTEMTRLPTYLILTLMRFTYNTREQRRTKILDDVEVSLEIDLPLHTNETGGVSPRKYKLWAIVVHSGTSAESGHYYCYARRLRRRESSSSSSSTEHEDSWFLFNDSHVSLTTFSSIRELSGRFHRDTAYVLMYRRIGEEEDGIVEDFGVSEDSDGRELVSKDVLAQVAADNAKFMMEMENAQKRKKEPRAKTSSNIIGWSDDKPPPPPPSCGGGGDGGHMATNRMVF